MTPEPVRDAKLTRRCRELVDRESIWWVMVGATAILVIVAITFPWALDQIPRHGWRQDLDIELGIVAGLLVSLVIVIRGLTGSWNLRALPRLDAAAGILHIERDWKPVAYRLVDLGELTVADVVRPHQRYVTWYTLESSTAGTLATETSRGKLERMAEALREHIAARTLAP